jgi:hypothetical protein
MNFRSILIVMAATALAVPSAAADRTLAESFPVDGIDAVQVASGVGDVRIVSGGADALHVEVTLTPRRGGMFSSMRKAEQEVETARLTSREVRGVLRLEIESESDEPRFEARWEVTAPARLGIEVELGVGDLEIAGFTSGVEVELGVGDASIKVDAGEVEASIGVGDAVVRAPAAAYASAEASSGVGGAAIDARGEVTSGKGFVGQSNSWRGSGTDTIELEAGVGDVRVVLD